MKVKNKFTIEVVINYEVPHETDLAHINIYEGDFASMLIDLIRKNGNELKHSQVNSKVNLESVGYSEAKIIL